MQSVLMEKNEHLGIITLNRPKSLNAMNADLVEEFHRALDIFVEDEEALVQTFCLGTEDCKEGILAFKQKRQPNFQGK